MTITHLLESMPATELVFWEILNGEEFLGDERADYNAACVHAAIANYAGKTLKDGVALTPLQLMPFREEPKKELTKEEIADRVKTSMNAMIGLQQAKKRALAMKGKST